MSVTIILQRYNNAFTKECFQYLNITHPSQNITKKFVNYQRLNLCRFNLIHYFTSKNFITNWSRRTTHSFFLQPLWPVMVLHIHFPSFILVQMIHALVKLVIQDLNCHGSMIFLIFHLRHIKSWHQPQLKLLFSLCFQVKG